MDFNFSVRDAYPMRLAPSLLESGNDKLPMTDRMDQRNEEYRPLFTSSLPDRPLFGTSNRKDRVVNVVVGCVTALLFVVTLLSAFIAHAPPKGLNVYFAICICFIGLSHVLLIYWYRIGDLDPKFRLLIYYNAFTMVLLSICALSFFFT